MQLAGTTSWQIRVDEPQHLAIGLYVRAAAGLTSAHPWLPPVSPPVAAIREGTEAAVPQWERWWDVAVRRSDVAWQPPFEDLAGAPELRTHVARHFMDAVRWINRQTARDRAILRYGDLLETHLVQALEDEAGHKAAPFVLEVTTIPCAGKTMWQLAPDHILVTEELLADRDAYSIRLAVVLGRLL